MNIGKNESATFKAINNEGVETEYEVMFTYESTETQKIISSTLTTLLMKTTKQKYMPTFTIPMEQKSNYFR